MTGIVTVGKIGEKKYEVPRCSIQLKKMTRQRDFGCSSAHPNHLVETIKYFVPRRYVSQNALHIGSKRAVFSDIQSYMVLFILSCAETYLRYSNSEA